MWTAVELREIRTFLVLCDELHFGRTAEKLGLTQSRVSQSLRDLERKLGSHLVHRTSRRVELTGDGARFRVQVSAALAQLDNTLRTAQALGQRLTEPLRLGGSSASAIGPAVQAVVDRYLADNPGGSVDFVGLPFRDRFGPLRRGEVDVMITGLPLRQPDITTSPVISHDLRLLAMSRTHPLAAHDDVSFEDLGSYEIGRLDIALPPELLEELAPSRTPGGCEIRRAARRLREPSELVLAIAQGAIVQPVVSVFADGYSHPDVVYRPIRDMPRSRTVLGWRCGSRQPNLRAFIDALHAELGR